MQKRTLKFRFLGLSFEYTGNNMKVFGGIIGLVTSLWFVWAFFAAGLSIYGIYLAFSASIILGIIALFLQPAPFIFGLVMFFGSMNLPMQIMSWYHAHSGDQVNVNVQVKHQ
jgi:hypothetical protein